jgi:type VI protein secretion system component VasK
MPSLEEYAKRMDVRGMMVTAIITALAFVVALFWNDAIRSAIDTIIPGSDKLSYKFLTAMVVTVVVVFVSWLLIKTQEVSKKHEKKLEELMKKQSALIDEQRRKLEQRSKKLHRGLARRI